MSSGKNGRIQVVIPSIGLKSEKLFQEDFFDNVDGCRGKEEYSPDSPTTNILLYLAQSSWWLYKSMADTLEITVGNLWHF